MPSAQYGVPMPFVKPAPPEILQEALASNDRLSKYAEAFSTEEIDPGMVATLSLNDIRALLPSAPVGDCLRLRALFQSLPAMVRSVPDPRRIRVGPLRPTFCPQERSKATWPRNTFGRAINSVSSRHSY